MDKVRDALRKLPHLAIEINDQCPFTEIHRECPRNADRWELTPNTDPITEPQEWADYLNRCLDLGFQGLINVHYYNEPLATPELLAEVMRLVPRGKFSLWTNGVLFKKVGVEYLRQFADIMLTMYPETPIPGEDVVALPNLMVQRANLDGRIREDVIPRWRPGFSHCNRPDWEMIVDNRGNGHICCGDWKAEIRFGNIQIDPIDNFLDNWVRVKDNLKSQLSFIDQATFETIPPVCQLCLTRSPWISQV